MKKCQRKCFHCGKWCISLESIIAGDEWSKDFPVGEDLCSSCKAYMKGK